MMLIRPSVFKFTRTYKCFNIVKNWKINTIQCFLWRNPPCFQPYTVQYIGLLILATHRCTKPWVLANNSGCYSKTAGLGICSSLRLLRSNEWMWVICTYCSGQMRDCEGIAQVAHDKWATLSDSLRSLMIN